MSSIQAAPVFIGPDDDELEDELGVRARGPVMRFLRQWRSPILSVGFILVVLGAWQLSYELKLINPLYTSAPSQIAAAAWTFLPSSAGLADMRVSGEEFIVGMAASIVVGVTLGLLMGWYHWFEELLALGLNIFYSLPLIALAPLIVLWFGIGLESKMVVVFTASLFPILVSTLTGVKNVDRSLINVARACDVSRLQMFRTVLLPGAVPSIVTGIRLGMATGLIGVIVGEFISSEQGIGFLISQAANNFNIKDLFVGLLVIAFASTILTTILKSIENRFNRWRVQ
jgi:ABC-type nitrate/sulfonate/bicarbonate transport system permease component